MIFPASQIASVHSGHITGILVPTSAKITPGRTRALRREIIERDTDGKQTGVRRSVVRQQALPGDEAKPVRLTIRSVIEVDVGKLTLPQARMCGYRTTAALRESWKAKHPRADFAQLVEFVLGDIRDKAKLLAWTGTGYGDYTESRHRSSDPDSEIVDPREIDLLVAKQKNVKKRIDASRETSARPLAEIAAGLEAANDPNAWRQEKWIIEQRLERAERKIGALAR